LKAVPYLLEGVAKRRGRCCQVLEGVVKTEWKVLPKGRASVTQVATGDSGGHQVVERVAKRGGRCCKKGRASVTQLQNG